MVRLVTTIDGVRGTVKILIEGTQNERQQLDFKWCKFDEDGFRTGFLASFSEEAIVVTERAAEQFIRTVVASIARSLSLVSADVVVINHLGEQLQDIEFLPPTFEGNEADILEFVSMQDTIKKMYSAYEQSGDLSSDFVEVCSAEGILDDILSLVQIKASGFVLAVRKPTTEE